jgi:hypothetical protein
VVEIALTPAEATLFGDEWDAVAGALRAQGREAVYTGSVPRRSADVGDPDVAAALTLDPDMASRDMAEVLLEHVRRIQPGRTRTLAIYGPTGLLEKRLDVGATSTSA